MEFGERVADKVRVSCCSSRRKEALIKLRLIDWNQLIRAGTLRRLLLGIDEDFVNSRDVITVLSLMRLAAGIILILRIHCRC